MSFTSLNTTPPTVSSASVFSGIPSDCTLYVPEESIDAYNAAEGRSYFTNVIGIENSGIADIKIVNESDIRAIYSIDGTRRNALANGINIVIMTNGTRRKIIVK